MGEQNKNLILYDGLKLEYVKVLEYQYTIMTIQRHTSR
jgi:hypothetical protein